MRVILGSPEVSIFLVMAVLFGVGMGTIDGFMFLYLKQLGEQPPCSLAGSGGGDTHIASGHRA